MFLGSLVRNFNPSPDRDHFAFITFNYKANMVFKFADSQYHDMDALLQKIANESIVTELQTRTDLALIMARDELFTEEGGDRPARPNVLVVITDGIPTHPDKKAFDFEGFANGIAKDLKVSIPRLLACHTGTVYFTNT